MVTASIEQLAKVKGILQQLDHATPQEMTENRRQAPRINVRLSLSVILLASANPAPFEIFTRNLSVSGIGFVSRRLFKAEERIAIRLQVKDLATKLCLARVTFGRYLTGGMYEMGAEFLECIEDPGHAPIPSHWMLPIPVVNFEKIPLPSIPASKSAKSGKEPPAKPPAIAGKPEEMKVEKPDGKKEPAQMIDAPPLS